MIFTINRVSGSWGRCSQWEKPCEKAQAVTVIAQNKQYKEGQMVWGICPEPVQMYILRLETLDELITLVQEVGDIIIYESPYVSTPGRTCDKSPWKESVRGLDKKPLEILDNAHGIIIYDDYME